MRKLQVLVATMNLTNEQQVNQLLTDMNLQSDYLIINQTKKEDCEIVNQKVISVQQKGLSASRNLALDKATGEIVLLADDDITYVTDYEAIIEKEHEKSPEADIICFWGESKNPQRKIKRMRSGRIGYLKVMRICSCQISAKLDRIKGVSFDEKFGTGSTYNRGEEGIFLCDCLRKGLKIKYVNKKIAELEQKESTWYKGYSKEFFQIQGKVFRRMYPRWYKVIVWQYAIRKYLQYRKQVSFQEAIKEML